MISDVLDRWLDKFHEFGQTAFTSWKSEEVANREKNWQHERKLAIEHLTSAFADAKYPGDIEVTGRQLETYEHKLFIELCREPDWRMFLNRLERGSRNRSSRSVSNGIADYLSQMSPRGFHYFLPAFLIHSLSDYSDVLGEYVLSRLSPDQEISRLPSTWLNQLLALMSPEQRQATAEAVQCIANMFLTNEMRNETVSFWCEVAKARIGNA